MNDINKSVDLHNLVWLTATMSVIAAINSIIAQTARIAAYKGLTFMMVGLYSLFIYKRHIK